MLHAGAWGAMRAGATVTGPIASQPRARAVQQGSQRALHVAWRVWVTLVTSSSMEGAGIRRITSHQAHAITGHGGHAKQTHAK